LLYQQKYGGEGVGFVNICSESAKGRASVVHKFSNNWKRYSFIRMKKGIILGISGNMSITKDSMFAKTWVQYSAGYYPKKNLLYQPTLFYGKVDSIPSYIYINDTINAIKLTGKSILNTYKISKKSLKKLKIYFKTNKTPIYGINFDNHKGVHIDNFSTRGNSGLPLSYLRYNLMHQFQKKLHYDLIIMQYGTNIISKKTNDYSWYLRSMSRALKHLKNAFPKVDVLSLSIADKGRKYGTTMQTDSAVYAVIDIQRQIAKQNNIGFINLFKLMGGKNSMVTWVEKTPKRARKDYTHFNSKGSKQIAKLIFEKLEKGYKTYKKKHSKTTKTAKKE